MKKRFDVVPAEHFTDYADMANNRRREPHGKPVSMVKVGLDYFFEYDLSDKPELVERFAKASPSDVSSRLLCSFGAWNLLVEMPKFARQASMREALLTLLGRDRLETFIYGDHLFVVTPGAFTKMVFVFNRPTVVEAGNFDEILATGEAFDMRGLWSKQDRESAKRARAFSCGHFHVFSCTFDCESLLDARNFVDNIGHGSDRPTSGHKVDIETGRMGRNELRPGAFLAPFKFEWSGSYLGDLEHLFDVGLVAQGESSGFAEGTSGFRMLRAMSDGKLPADERARRLLKRREVELTEHFWEHFAGIPENRFVEPDLLVDWGYDCSWWDVNGVKRDRSVAVRSRRMQDTVCSTDEILTEARGIFEAAMTLLDHAEARHVDPVWNARTARVALGKSAFVAGYAGAPARLIYGGMFGRASILKICNHIADVFDPVGWETGGNLRSNRVNGFGNVPYRVAAYKLGQAPSSHKMMAAEKKLRMFLRDDCWLSKEEIVLILAGLADPSPGEDDLLYTHVMPLHELIERGLVHEI